MCENRHEYTFPVSFDVTSNTPTNVLIAPAFASIGRAVALLSCSFIPVADISPSPRFPDPLPGLPAGRGRGIHMSITPHRCSDARARRHTNSLIQQHFFQCRQ